MATDGQGTKWHANTAENFSHLSRAHEHYRRQTDRQTDGRRHIANVKSNKSLQKRDKFWQHGQCQYGRQT